jgi:hypothetical protein
MLSDPSCAVRPSSTKKRPAPVSSTIRRLWNFRGALITRHSGQSTIRLLFRSPCWCVLVAWLTICIPGIRGQESKANPQENNSTSAKQTENPHFKSLHIHFNLSPAESVDVPQALDVSQSEHEASSSPELEKAEGCSASKPENAAEKRGGEVVIAPIPLSNPAIGSGIILGLGYVFPLSKHDRVSPPSTIGGAGMYASSGSWAVGGLGKLFLREDRYRLTLAYGRGEVNYKLFGVGNIAGAAGISVPIHQGGGALFVEPLVHLKWKLFVGPRYQWRSLGVTLEGENLPPHINITPKEFNSKTAALGFHAQQDRLDSQFYPKHGTLSEVVGDFFHQGLGSDLNYESYWFAFNNFSTLSPKQVIAFRVYGCIVAGDVPFYDLCLMGAHNDLRGYEAGRYRDRLMLSTQVEYRLELPKRFGLAAFFGVGEVAPTIGSFDAANLLPAGGAGLRFLVAKKNHINLRFDYGIGKDGGGFYMGVAEAF